MAYTPNCLVCGKVIPEGEPYYSLETSVEVSRGGEVEVRNAEAIGVRCLACGPFDVEALASFAGHATRGPAAGPGRPA